MRDAAQLHRTSDPVSSAAAARTHVASGVHKRQVDRVEDLLILSERRLGRAVTASEIEQVASEILTVGEPRLESYLILKRLNDLRAEGRVDAYAIVVCPVSKRKKQTWRAVRQTKLALIESIRGEKARPSRREILAALQELLEAVQRSVCDGSGPAQDQARDVLRRSR